jgi:beta-N-acetylhexosaminidase
MRKAFITGVAGTSLAADEHAFLAAERPAGLILFTRNAQSADQIRRLVGEVRSAVGGDMLVLVDQEGGRVQRLRPPIARLLPPAAAFMAHFAGDTTAAAEAARLVARLAADDLTTLGIDCNCAPVLDVPVPGAHDIIGNRAYAAEPATIATLGRAVADGLMGGGVLPVIKHVPGHGRATADSHLELPVVTTPRAELKATDFLPFVALRDVPAAMTAHVVYTAIDPTDPASTSHSLVADVIRRSMGYDGLLMSDDLGMHALTGGFADRTRRVIAAGCDLALYCKGEPEEMRAVASAAPSLGGDALARFERAVAVTRMPRQDYDRDRAEAILGAMLAPSA